MPNNKELKVKILQSAAEPEKVAALAAKLCYSASDIDSLACKISHNEQSDFIDKIALMGHHSVFEHISFTFGVEGVSRALTHQLVRHRVASYSQQSQRYVKAKSDLDVITPVSISSNTKAGEVFQAALETIEKAYASLLELGIPPEDARYILPNAAETKIIITMNARELLHFFSIRSCNRAQWEIRALSDKMLALCYSLAPSIFKNAGPSCCRGKCSEGKFSCGEQAEVRKHIENLKGTKSEPHSGER